MGSVLVVPRVIMARTIVHGMVWAHITVTAATKNRVDALRHGVQPASLTVTCQEGHGLVCKTARASFAKSVRLDLVRSDCVYVQVPRFFRTVGTVHNDLFSRRSLHFNTPSHIPDSAFTRTRFLLSLQFSSALHPNFLIRITSIALCISSLTLIRAVKIKTVVRSTTK
jgi:hypothetical protein